MIEYIPTENKFEVPEIPKVTGYQKQFSIAPPRGDVSENVSDTSPEPETPIEKIEEPIKDVVEEKIKKEPLSTSRGIITIDKNVAIGNMQKVLDKFSEAGINLRVTSGARKAGLFGKAGNKSHHVSGNAIDVVPGEGETWNSMKEKINNNEALKAWLRENKIGILDETNPTTMKKTGATGAHWHIGPDKAALADFELIFGKNGTKFPKFQSGGVIKIALNNINNTLKNYRDPRSSMQHIRINSPIKQSNFKGFKNGHFGGAGAGSSWDWNERIDGLMDKTNPDFHYPYMDYVRNTPTVINEKGRSFSDAYATARKAGLTTFTFNNKLYNTEYNPNAKPAVERYETITVPMILREVLNGNQEPIKDSTSLTPIPPELRGERMGTERRINGKLEHLY